MSEKIGILVQARMSSTRFPGKSLELIGDKPLIYYVLMRLLLTGLPVIICTSRDRSDDKLCEYLEDQNFEYFRGSLENVLERYIEAAQFFGVEKIVRVTGDNPLVDHEYLIQSLPLFKEYDYVDGIYSNGLIKGTGFEFVHLSELISICSNEEQHREHVTTWLRENVSQSEKRIQLCPNEHNRFREDIFLTCDYPEDLILLSEIFKMFNFRIDIAIREIVSFLEDNPSLKTINCTKHYS